MSSTKPSEKGEFLNRIRDSGPGEYKITATLPDGTEYSVTVKVLRD